MVRIDLAFKVCVKDFAFLLAGKLIPILLKDLADSGKIRKGQCLMLLGFGVGYSWAGAIVNW